MTLKQQIDSDLKQALLAGDKAKVTTLRGLKAAILDAEVTAGARADGLPEIEIEKLLQKEAKKRRESIQIYRQNGRDDLADSEQAELSLLEEYLPKQLSEDELSGIIDVIITTTGASSIKELGKVIGAVKAQVGNTADGALVAQIVKQKLGD
ncbi:aspartyl-tRNA amidotransferase subunit B [Alphaproteobacteria bacterium]|nr:aspartyl-tRNA amidotransferase subunit B [Alphaproteobacteria bacterium]